MNSHEIKINFFRACLLFQRRINYVKNIIYKLFIRRYLHSLNKLVLDIKKYLKDDALSLKKSDKYRIDGEFKNFEKGI